MKNICLTIAAGLIVSHGAYACPDLSGNYKTVDGSIRKEIQMRKEAAGIFTLVDTGGLPIVIDGKSHALQGPITYVASCNQTEITVRILQASNEVGSMAYSKIPNGIHIRSVGIENSDEDFFKY